MRASAPHWLTPAPRCWPRPGAPTWDPNPDRMPAPETQRASLSVCGSDGCVADRGLLKHTGCSESPGCGTYGINWASHVPPRFNIVRLVAQAREEVPAATGDELAPEELKSSSASEKQQEFSKFLEAGQMDVIITEPGSIGLLLNTDSVLGACQPKIESIAPGGQLAQYTKLVSGMALLTVDGAVVKDREHCIELISSASRPMRLRFGTAKSQALQKLR